MSISLESALTTCKVYAGAANRAQSDRFENPDIMTCPTWTGQDVAGRPVCADSFMTKSAGCNSAMDRVVVENNVSRPQYFEYITLDAQGLDVPYGDTFSYQGMKASDDYIYNEIPKITGHFGGAPSMATNEEHCDLRTYQTKPRTANNVTHEYFRQQPSDQRVMRSGETFKRAADNASQAYKAQGYMNASGFGNV